VTEALKAVAATLNRLVDDLRAAFRRLTAALHDTFASLQQSKGLWTEQQTPNRARKSRIPAAQRSPWP
jgi:hypothetical protein